MKFFTDPILRTAKQVTAFAQKALEGGKSFVTTSWNKIPLFASTEAVTHDEDTLTDETHYFMIPFRPAKQGYALYTARRLPRGYAAVNDLPKARVFHLPGPGSEELLERLILDQAVQKKKDEARPDEIKPIAERLSEIGEEVDKQASRLTGGLLIVGGVVAIVNPVIGVGILAHALAPAIGAKLGGEGLKYLGEKGRQRRTENEEKKREQEAKAELKSIQIKIAVNPLLQTLEEALGTTAEEFEPMLDGYDFARFAMDGWQGQQMLQLTARAVGSVYAAVLKNPKTHAEANLGPEDVRWLETLKGFEKMDCA